MPKFLLGLDNGGTVIKAGLYDADTGVEVASAGERCEHQPGPPGHYERDMEEIYAANTTVIRAVLKNAGVDGKAVAAVATSGHGNGAHFVDEQGKPAGYSIESSDSRAAEYVGRFLTDGTFEKANDLNNQAMWPALSCLLRRCMVVNDPERMRRVRWYFNIGEYVRLRLTGVPGAEITTMSGTGLINHKIRGYDPVLLDYLGIGAFAEKLPPLMESTQIGGSITAEAAAATGLAAGTPVAAGLYDIDAASLACDAMDEGTITVVAGTWANNLFVSKKLVMNRELFSGMVYAKPGYWFHLEGSPTGSANQEWFVERFLQQEVEEAKRNGTSPYATCNAALRDLSPADSDIVFTPFLYGYNAVRDARGMFIGLQGLHRKEHLIRAVCEGVCFSHRWHVDRIRSFIDKPVTVARMAGGAAKSPEWVQMFADVLNLPMQVSDVKELGTLGAAMCAGVAIGLFKDFEAAAERMTRMKEPIQPNPAAVARYEGKYRNYLRALEASKVYWQ